MKKMLHLMGLICALLLARSVSATTTYAYVPLSGTNQIKVIDTTNNTVAAIFTVNPNNVPFPNVFNIVITPDNQFAYVTDGGYLVNVIKTSNGTLVDTITLTDTPTQEIAITPDGSHVYIAFYNGAVNVIQTSDNTVTATITVGNELSSIAVNPNGLYVYVTNESDNAVNVIQTSDNTVIATIPVGSGPGGIAVTPITGAYAYVADFSDNAVNVINTSNNLVVATISVAGSPNQIAITPDGSQVYVSLYNSSGVSVIQTSNNTVSATLSVGIQPYGLAVTPDGTHVYVDNKYSGNVSVIQTSDNTVIATISVGESPYFIAMATVTLSPFSTFNVVGKTNKNVFFTQTDLFNSITWTNVSKATKYEIYRDKALTQLIATIPSMQFPKFEDHNLIPNTTYTYYIVAKMENTILEQGSVKVKT